MNYAISDDRPSFSNLPNEIKSFFPTSLSKNDLSCCVRVNKEWYQLFTPQLWRNIQLVMPDNILRFKLATRSGDVLDRNARFIRSFDGHLHGDGIQLLHRGLNQGLFHLQELNLACGIHPIVYFSAEEGQEDTTTTPPAEELASWLPIFSSANLGFGPRTVSGYSQYTSSNDKDSIEWLLEVLQKNPDLKTLNITGVDAQSGLLKVLLGLPLGLERLRIQLSDYHLGELNLEDDNPEGFFVSLIDPASLKQSYDLKYLSISAKYQDSKRIVKLLERCPRLQQLRLENVSASTLTAITSILRTSCPDLIELQITLGFESGASDHLIATLIESGSVSGWSTVSIDVSGLQGTLPFQALLKHSATLENVHFHGLSSAFPSLMIQQLLTTSPKLKRFWSQVTEDNRGDEPKLLVNDLLKRPWVCRSLVSFRCLISGVPRPDLKRTTAGIRMRGPLHEGTLEDAYAIQHEVYDQLANLTALQELGLGHQVYSDEIELEIAQTIYGNNNINSNDNDDLVEQEGEENEEEDEDGLEEGLQYECLSLSLESGFDRLSTLKDLRVFDFRNMSVPKFWSKQEQEWVKSHWKNLDPLYSSGRNTWGLKYPDLFWREFGVPEQEYNMEDYADPHGGSHYH
ncbi:hypothetical protein BGZ83_003754 [Gryganskiella cystojenkinii]|nr:hypothetical protein BGZ83_003754 [Gryganskiella cystojenkinii]